jgi:predicted DNA binding CopG/RHH family protein
MTKATSKKTTITVKLDTKLVRRVKHVAARRGISLRALFVEILVESVNQDKR